MRVAILSDIHGNAVAFDRVIADAMSFGVVDEIWCVGDIVGYGPSPNDCVAELIDASYLGTRVVAVAGNHDRAATGGLSTDDFNPAARRAAEWTASHLAARSHAYLERLPLSATAGPNDQFTLVHGSPSDPLWAYTASSWDASASLEAVATAHCIVGHTHVPALFASGPSKPGDASEAGWPSEEWFDDDTPCELRPGVRYLLNPGSVGQPRDGDPRAAYVLYESDDEGNEVVRLRRVPYDIAGVQARMRAEGLPEMLANRLSVGR